MKRQRPRMSYANVTATLALVIAVAGGTAFAAGKIGTKQLKNNAVKTKKIAKGAVTTPKIANGAVNAAKLATGAVTEAKLAAGAVTAVKLATGAVGAAAIATGAVGTDELATDAVTSDKILEEGVDSSDLEDGTIGSSDINNTLEDALDADCPAGMVQLVRVCADSSERSVAVWQTAVRDCVDEGLMMPDASVASALVQNAAIAQDVELWTSNFIGEATATSLVTERQAGGVVIAGEPTSNTNVYRCVAPLNDDN